MIPWQIRYKTGYSNTKGTWYVVEEFTNEVVDCGFTSYQEALEASDKRNHHLTQKRLRNNSL